MTDTTSPETITVQLSKPIVDGEKKITALTFREATAGDACLSDAVSGDFTKMLAILSGMCGQPLPVLKQVPMRDIALIISKTESLMGEAGAVVGSTS